MVTLDPQLEAQRNGEPFTVGSVDLGSNSFHMIIAQLQDQELHIVDRLRDPVCLADGLDEKDRLSDESQERAVAALARFSQRLREIPPGYVRAVGTNTLRRASDASNVRARFEQALGRPIEVISGQEEARLVYLGVSGSDFSEARRLVVDIGGGSTEVILGEGSEVLLSHSLFMGCVKSTRSHFADGAITREQFRTAEIEARLELRSIETRLCAAGWECAVGSSGTIAAVEQWLRNEGETLITLPGLKRLRKSMIRTGWIRDLKIEGVRGDRARVLPGGVAILIALFRSLEIESMASTTGALREGVLYDLVGRIRHEDVRDRTVKRLVRRYHVDDEQARRVERSALLLLRQLEPAAVLGDPAPIDFQTAEKSLSWAARLHEVGLGVSYTGYHRHGSYLVDHSDMPGFSSGDQRLLAALIRCHRRKLSREFLAELPPALAEVALRLCVILRLAVLLHRGRVPAAHPGFAVNASWTEATLVFPAGWLEGHPLTAADLRREKSYLKSIGLKLVVSEISDASATG
jgi:exopolyphosphatase/guanosine-5'-triphosphate,3'-diphosphate pyrophosphatase